MLLQQLVNGLMQGSIYALTGMGLTLVMGLLGRLNIAHGDVFMTGAFGMVAASMFGLPVWAAAIAGVGVAIVVAVIIERTCFYPLRNASFLSPMLSTVAFGILLQSLVILIFGSEPSRLEREGLPAQFQIGPVLVSSIQIAILVISSVLMISIDRFVYASRWGRALRATSENRENAELMGINASKVILMTFVISGLLAGVAGMLVLQVYAQVSPLIGIRMGLIGMVAMVIGGLGNLRGAMAGGILIGLVEAINDSYFSAGWRDFVIFSLFFLVLMVRPQGLLTTSKG